MNTVTGVHIATFSAGTLAHVVTTLGVRWEVFNTSGKGIHTLYYRLFTLKTIII
jgi:hypothetical protein